MASIGDFGVKKLPHFSELWPACVNAVHYEIPKCLFIMKVHYLRILLIYNSIL